MGKQWSMNMVCEQWGMKRVCEQWDMKRVCEQSEQWGMKRVCEQCKRGLSPDVGCPHSQHLTYILMRHPSFVDLGGQCG